jgi:sulfur-carrier protein
VSVTFHIPGPLRSFAGGRNQVELEAPAATLSDALQALWVACPGIHDRVVTEEGQIREHINIFVGKKDVRYAGGLATPIPSGAEISIVPALSGGWMVAGPRPAVGS